MHKLRLSLSVNNQGLKPAPLKDFQIFKKERWYSTHKPLTAISYPQMLWA